MNSYRLKSEEKIIYALRDLYSARGYSRYKMSKFEEYDLYVRNKDFLISDSVITFTDTNGKLMALKPDVTLSIVKNNRDIPDCVQKLYYNENVYRVSKGTRSFREIMQIGLECIGKIDEYCNLEVLNLAGMSLACISDNWVLNISHLGVFAEILDGVSEENRGEIFRCMCEKNLHELKIACERAGIDNECRRKLEKLLNAYGDPEQVLNELRDTIDDSPSLQQLVKLTSILKNSAFRDKLRIDFSVVSDVSYYNGIVFKGFVEGVPSAVLSGGQYDRLMRKMNRSSGAIGFAVYMDQLERLNESDRKYDVDVLLLYDDKEDVAKLHMEAEKLRNSGRSVVVQKSSPQNLRYRSLARFERGEVKFLEEHA